MNVGGFELNLADLATLLGVLGTLASTWRLRVTQKARGAQIEAIEHEVKPNSGASMRDAVNRIETTVADLAERQKAAEVRDIEHSQRLRVLEDRTDHRRWWRR
ncbi:MAG: hypothetical protein JNM77_08755 [Pseudonocardia sp.]|nr:hypothetical protein [Pseudonocardia sp.]